MIFFFFYLVSFTSFRDTKFLVIPKPTSDLQATGDIRSSHHARSTHKQSSLLGRERGEAEVRLDDAEVGEQLLGLLVGDRRGDNDIVAGDPVDGGGDAVLVAGLEGVDDAEDLGGVAAGGGRVGEDGADLLVGVNEEDGADGEGNALLVDVGGVLVVDPGIPMLASTLTYSRGVLDLHVVGEGDLALLVANDGEADIAAGDLSNVLDPAVVGLDGVGGEAN